MSIASQATQHKFPFSYEAVFDGLVEVIPRVGMSVKNQNKVIGRITASTGMSFLSWGESLTIIVKKTDKNSTTIGNEAALIVGLNLARHQKNFNKIIAALSQNLQLKAWRKNAPNIAEIAQALAHVKKLDVDSVMSAVCKASEEQRKEWCENATIATEITRMRAENTAEIAQALANLKKIDVAAMTDVVMAATKEQRKAWRENAAIAAEIALIRAENERICDEEYDQAINNLKKINETSAVNLAKKHRREMAEEQQRKNAAIEAEVARIRAVNAAKCATDGELRL